MPDVALDSSLLINFLAIDRTEILANLPGFRFHVLNHVINEVVDTAQRPRLEEALDKSHVTAFEMTDIGTIADYLSLRRRLGDGESATIAAAAHHGWIVGMDERGRAKREAIDRVGVGSVLNTPGILVLSVRTGQLSLDDAEEIRLELAARRYLIKHTMGELLDQ